MGELADLMSKPEPEQLARDLHVLASLQFSTDIVFLQDLVSFELKSL